MIAIVAIKSRAEIFAYSASSRAASILASVCLNLNGHAVGRAFIGGVCVVSSQELVHGKWHFKHDLGNKVYKEWAVFIRSPRAFGMVYIDTLLTKLLNNA